jgi:ribonuclease R
VTLDAMYVEGLVHITELGGEYFKFDEMRQELRGERTGIRYAIGTRVRVQVSRVDLDGRKIDFRLVREGEELTARAMKDKGVGAGVPVKASAKRSARGGGKSAEAVSLPVERAEGAQSAMQAFKSAVKKAANKMKGRKPRRG